MAIQKDGGRNSEQGHQGADAVKGGILLDRRHDSSRHADHHTQKRAQHRQLQCVGVTVHNLVKYRPPGLVGRPEIPVQHPHEVSPKADQIRVVQSVLLVNLLYLVRRGVLPQNRVGRIAGCNIHERKHDDGDPKQDRQHHQNPFSNIFQQMLPLLADLKSRRPQATPAAKGVHCKIMPDTLLEIHKLEIVLLVGRCDTESPHIQLASRVELLVPYRKHHIVFHEHLLAAVVQLVAGIMIGGG